LHAHESNVTTRQRNRLTRLGFHFLFVGTFAMIGGALRGFNLLLVLAGLVVGTLIMHWRWSRRSVEDISVSRRLPGEAFVGKPFRVGYMLQSSSRFFPTWMLRVEDKLLREGESDSASSTANCGVGLLSPSQSKLAFVDCTVRRRGVYQFGPIALVSSFPFSLIAARKTIQSTETLHVYPSLLTLNAHWNRRFASHGGGDATSVRRSGAGGGEFFGLREWQSGDSTRWIHWRTTARTGVPAVRQFEQRRRYEMCLLLDAYGQSNQSAPRSLLDRARSLGPSGVDSDEDADFERAVSLAATLLVQMHRMPSSRIVLSVASTAASTVQLGGQRVHCELARRKMLQLLAATGPSEAPKLCEAIGETARLVAFTNELTVISTRGMNDAIDSEPELKAAIAQWGRHNRLSWINVNSSDFHQFVALNWSRSKPRSNKGSGKSGFETASSKSQ
jgi:uncharacterized protein (DUF58 family)